CEELPTENRGRSGISLRPVRRIPCVRKRGGSATAQPQSWISWSCLAGHGTLPCDAGSTGITCRSFKHTVCYPRPSPSPLTGVLQHVIQRASMTNRFLYKRERQNR